MFDPRFLVLKYVRYWRRRNAIERKVPVATIVGSRSSAENYKGNTLKMHSIAVKAAVMLFGITLCAGANSQQMKCDESDLNDVRCTVALSSGGTTAVTSPKSISKQAAASARVPYVRFLEGEELKQSVRDLNRLTRSSSAIDKRGSQKEEQRNSSGEGFVINSASSLTLNSEYDVFNGDYNQDGLTDLYLRTKPRVLMLHGDITIPIARHRAHDNQLLIQTSSGSFSVQSNVTDSYVGYGSGWSSSLVEVSLHDFNLDAYPDFLVKNFLAEPSFSGTIDNHIVYSQGDEQSVIRELDGDVADFARELFGWLLDPFYFIVEAIDNYWYSLEGGDIVTGWFHISYINIFYSYDNGLTFLDANDDPNDPNNSPSFCDDYPLNCVFDALRGVWLVYGTFQEDITVVVDYSNFNGDFVALSQAAGEAFHDPNAIASTDFEPVESILEGQLGIEVGDTLEGLLRLAEPRPQTTSPSGTAQPPSYDTRQFPEGPANDPNYKRRNPGSWRIILGKIGLVLCAIALDPDCVVSAGDPNEVEKLDWHYFGWEWALNQLIEEGVDPDSDMLRAVIGESGPRNAAVPRIPTYAMQNNAMYLDFGITPEEEWPGDALVWEANSGWINYLMTLETEFLDIGNDKRRSTRGMFYPCERFQIGAFKPYLRTVDTDDHTLNHVVGSCEL